MAHPSSAHDPSAAPGLPEIRDEAADTPMWIPALGLGLFVLATVWLVISAAFEDVSEETGAPVEVAAQPAAGEPPGALEPSGE